MEFLPEDTDTVSLVVSGVLQVVVLFEGAYLFHISRMFFKCINEKM